MILEDQQVILTQGKDKKIHRRWMCLQKKFIAISKSREKHIGNGEKGKSLRKYTKEQQELWGQNQESKSEKWDTTGKKCERQQEGILHIYQTEKKDEENCGVTFPKWGYAIHEW